MPKKNKATLLEEANKILKMVNSVKIDNSQAEYNLESIRNIAMDYVNEARMIAPAMTAAIAITLLNMGLCHELSQRFLIEYFLKFKSKEIALLILGNPELGHTAYDHMLIQLNPTSVPTQLNVCRESDVPMLAEKKDSMRIEDYFRENAESVYADPLLNCVGDNAHGLEALSEYCKKHNQTHVVGVRPFDKIDPVISAIKIMDNAIICANGLKEMLMLNVPTPSLSALTLPQPSFARKIIQFSAGASTDDRAPNKESRSIIYYDHARKTNVANRQINLNEIQQRANGSALAYQALLKQDLSYPVDIFMTRVLGYLTPEALNLLMFAILDLMQPGSNLHIEIINNENTSSEKKDTLYTRNIEGGYIPSFFAPRTDIKIINHTLTPDQQHARGETVEQFVVKKR